MNGLRNAGISIIGAGNIAVNLTYALKKKGYSIRYIYNRSDVSGRRLARKTGAEFSDDPAVAGKKAGIIFLAVSDDAIRTMAEWIRPGHSLVVHCSGTTGISVFKGLFVNYGVFNPVQTFLRSRPASMKNVPFCIEANNPANEKILTKLALDLGGKPYLMSSQQRMIVHLCSVLTSNFTNYLNSAAEDLLTSHGISFEILLPLLRRTARNAEKTNIFSRQTGPAIRGDRDVIKKHLALLANHADHAGIYKILTESIIKYKRYNGKL